MRCRPAVGCDDILVTVRGTCVHSSHPGLIMKVVAFRGFNEIDLILHALMRHHIVAVL